MKNPLFVLRFEETSEYYAISFYSLCQETLHVVLANGSSAGHDDAQGRRQFFCQLGTVDHEESCRETEKERERNWLERARTELD